MSGHLARTTAAATSEQLSDWLDATDAAIAALGSPSSLSLGGAQPTPAKTLHVVGDVAIEYGDGANFVERAGSGLIIHRNQSAVPTAITPYLHLIVQGKGDNATPIGVSGMYVQARDRSDVTGANKGVLYGGQFVVVPTVSRNNVPNDDIACLVLKNEAGGAFKGTDCIYIGVNSNFVAGAPEWISGLLVDCNADYALRASKTYVNGLRLDEATFTGLAVKVKQGARIGSLNAAGNADVDLLELNGSNDLKLMSGGGNVVMGGATATPSNASGRVLHIVSANAANQPELRIENTASGGTAEVNLYANTGAVTRARLVNQGGNFYAGTVSAIPMELRTTNVARLTIPAAGGLTIADANDIAVGTTTGTKIGTATAQKIAFHNATPVVQRAGAAQVAAAVTAATNTSPFGYTTAAQADAIVTLVNELRAALVEKGLIKGAA